MPHTPGPWFVFEGRPCVAGPHQKNGTALIAMCGASLRNEDENAANARLVAAAPGLLAACESMLLDVHQYLRRGGKLTDSETHHVSLMRAAVALAKGE